jgi:hypothetical protein
MTIAVDVTFHGQGATLENYKKGLTVMGTSPGGHHPDPNCLFHWANEIGGGVHVTDVWKSRETFEVFAEGKLATTAEQVGLPKPQVKFTDVASTLTGN